MKIGDAVRFLDDYEVGKVVRLTKEKAQVLLYSQSRVWKDQSDLEVFVPEPLTSEVLRNIFRMNIDFDVYRFGYDYLNASFHEVSYQPTIDDLLALAMNCKVKHLTNQDLIEWVFTVNMDLKDCYQKQAESNSDELERLLLAKPKDVFEYFFDLLQVDIDELDNYPLEMVFPLDEMIKTLSLCKKQLHLPLLEREYSSDVMERFLDTIMMDDLVDSLDEEKLQLFQRFTNTLVQQQSIVGLETMAECSGGGNVAFSCDWSICCDCLQKLYEMTGEASYAIGLADIYYHGRSNRGIPQYEKAFSYLSIGVAAGSDEAKLQLAEMFFQGYYVVKNQKVAMNLYQEVYQENLKIFEKGFFDCKLAEVCYRLGEIWYEAEHLKKASYFLLQAQLAIQKRRQQTHLNDDLELYDRIVEALEKCYRRQPFSNTHCDMANLDFLSFFFEEFHRVKLSLKPLKGQKVKIVARRIPYDDELECPILFSFVPMKTALLTEKLQMTAYGVDSLPDNLYFEATAIKMEDDEAVFYDYNQVVCRIHGLFYRIKKPIKKTSQEVRLVQVKVDQQYQDFLCDDLFVFAACEVLVNWNGEKRKGFVVKSFVRLENELAKPLDQYESILQVVE